MQLGFKDKPRKTATRPEQGHVAANLKSKRKEARQKAGVQLPPKADVRTAAAHPRVPPRQGRRVRRSEGRVQARPEANFKVERIKASGDGASKTFEAYTEDMTLKVGQVLTVGDVFKDVLAVDVIGTSKGRGTQGVMKRHELRRPARGARRQEGPPAGRFDRRRWRATAVAVGRRRA